MPEVCRTCLEEVSMEESYFRLSEDDKSRRIVNEFSVLVPEVCLGLVKDPVVCTSCISILHLAYRFKCKCLQTETTIKNMIDMVTGQHQPTQAQNAPPFTVDLVSGLELNRGISKEVNAAAEKGEEVVVKLEEPSDYPEMDTPDLVSLTSDEVIVKTEALPVPTVSLNRLPEEVAQAQTVSVRDVSDIVKENSPVEFKRKRGRPPKEHPRPWLRAKNMHTHTCEICSYIAKSKGGLAVHKRVHVKVERIHKQQAVTIEASSYDTEDNMCCDCGHVAGTETELQYHRLKHWLDTPFGCIVCTYTTFIKHNLVEHMKCHGAQGDCKPMYRQASI